MLEKLYADKTEKQLSSALRLYAALLIVSIVLPILFVAFGYYATGKINFGQSAIFLVIIFWSSLNVSYLKGVLKNKVDK